MLCCFLLTALWPCSLWALDVNAVRFSAHADKTRVVLSANATIDQYQFFKLSNPERYVLDLTGAKLKAAIPKLPTAAAVKAIRTRAYPNKLRVVFDMKRSVGQKVFTLNAANRPARLVVDFMEQIGSSKPIITKFKPRPLTKPGQSSQNVKLQSSKVALPPRYLREVVILIDAGHGGKDPGAIGPRGTHEKKVVLRIAEKLKNYIDKEPGMRAVMTRRGDYYVPLRKRLLKARGASSDLFISIHADAFKNRRLHGASVYALSQRGATSEAARWLAEKENYSELGGVDLTDKDRLLKTVLIDLSQSITIKDSLRLGEHVLSSLKQVVTLRSRRVEQARFVVLKSPDIPSLLIETGFISNRREELKLRNHTYQSKLAHAILQGIKGYFKERPLKGTVFSQSKTIYKVRSGDSLGRLADRFGVAVSQLKQANVIKSDKLYVGQLLTIPVS